MTRRRLLLPGVALLLLAALAAGLLLGPARVAPATLPALLADRLGWAPLPPPLAGEAAILQAIRLPRALMAAIIGAGLGAAGAVMQGLFRNPLADPGLVGVSAGAALAAVGALVLGAGGAGLGLWLVPVAAFCGGLAATLAGLALARDGGGLDAATLLLAGIAINALCAAGTGLLIFLADERQLRDITFWTLGSLAGVRMAQLPVALLLILAPTLALLSLARPLNSFLLGDSEAFFLGERVQHVRLAAVLLSAVAVSAGVALTGLVAFVGLVVPHLLRLAGAGDHRLLLPGSALLGAALLLLADLGARSLAAPAELPLGVVTALIGAPFFLWLLRRGRSA
ncbi:iron ABC transporter permease [Roseomonas sp. 18066]|uniref:FecCD family ABC transporter permease n=1 Tax=Roseomonas sp. 18066 TaxID=2681412 RepID=UPI0013592B4E|nr:iron ABC transporter permease [Roseomonas sp. 18066]